MQSNSTSKVRVSPLFRYKLDNNLDIFMYCWLTIKINFETGFAHKNRR